MKKLKSIVAVLLAMMMIAVVAVIPASAANYSTDYSKHKEPTRALYYKSSNVMTGDDVKWFQCAINYCVVNKGLNTSKLDVDGSFGPASQTATKAFQKKYNLDVDGSFGPSSLKKMKSILPDPTPTTTTTNNSNSTSKKLAVDWSIIQKTGYQPESGPCGCYALAYCRDILDKKAHSWTEYSEGYLSSKGRYSYTVSWGKGNYTVKTGSSKQAVLKAAYDNINKGKPVVVRVTGNGSSGHYVCVCGYQNVTNVNNLSEKNFLIIDSASKTAFNRKVTSMTSGSTGYSIHSNKQYAVAK